MDKEEKYYNKIMKQDKMSLEEAKNIIDEMYQDKYKIIEENNTIYVDRLDEVKFTNLEFASVRMLREVQSLRRKLEKLQKENEELKQENRRIKFFSNNLYIEDYIPKRVIKNKIKEKQDKINKLHSASDCVIIDDLENQISVLQELLESSDINE